MDKLLTLEPGMIVWTFISFAILLFTLKNSRGNPCSTCSMAGNKRIKGDMERAEKARTEAELLIAQHKELLAKAEQQAYAIIDEAKKSGEKVREGVIQSAQDQARQLVEQAKAEIVREKDTALAELRTEVADLAIQAAGKIPQGRSERRTA